MKLKVIVALLLLAVSQAFSFTGLGAGGTFSAGMDEVVCASMTFRQDTQPWSFFLNAHINEKKISFFADDWFIYENISGGLDYFVLWGVSGGFLKDEGRMEISTGCRFGAGLDLMLAGRHAEGFVQAVWNPYFGVKTSDYKDSGKYGPLFRPVNFPCTAGIRFWF